MALPSAYLVTTRNLVPLFTAIRAAKAPTKFTQRFLEELDFKSTNDRLYINVLKALGLLTEDGSPTARYYEFMDQRQSGRVLAEALEEAYEDLFQVRRDAQNFSKDELKGKFKTLTQGQYSDTVVERMATTFVALAEAADWDASRNDGETEATTSGQEIPRDTTDPLEAGPPPHPPGQKPLPPPAPSAPGDVVKLGGFVYNIELHLPESRDPAVYEALFRSLKAHLLS